MTTPWPADAWYLQVDDLIVDLRFRRLIYAGQSVEVPQRVFDLLLLLLSEPHKLHTRTELFDRLWAGTVVEDTNLSQNVWLLRKALGEQRKSWIRTVAKSGYVFDAPVTVQWFKQLPPIPTADSTSSVAITNSTDALAEDAGHALATAHRQAVDAPLRPESIARLDSAAPVAPSLRKHPFRIGLATTLVLFAAVALLGRYWRPAAGAEGQSVALVTMQGQDTSTAWAANLLEQWLSWKLDSLPEVNLLTESDLAAGSGPARVDAVFLSSAPAADDPDKIVVYVRVLKDGKEERLEAKGEQTQAAALVDSLSGQVMARLVPDHRAPWPKLELSAQAAKRYAQVSQAQRSRDWISVVRIGKELVASAPRFGLMRLQLASAQADLSNFTAAEREMDAAVELLAPASPGVIDQLQTRRLAFDQARAPQALAIYSSLADRYPNKSAYQLAYLNLLITAGKPGEVLSRLDTLPDSRDPVGVRLAKGQLRGDAYRLLGEPESMRSVAAATESTARELGPQWILERADATLLLALADTMQFPQRGASPYYRQAAELYKRAGNSTKELLAQYLFNATALPGADSDALIDELLARARAGGYRRMEVVALLASAERHLRAVNTLEYRARLQQAYAIAKDSGDLHSLHQMDGPLLRDDLLSARLDVAATRISRLRAADLQTAMRYQYGEYAAELLTMSGRYAEAIALLDDVEKLQLSSTKRADVGIRGSLGCIRGEVLSALGRLSEARKSVDRCAESTYRSARASALLEESRIEWLVGDRDRAADLLAQAAQSTVAGPDRKWLHAIGMADLALRLGDEPRASRIYAELLPQLQSSGYTLLIAMARTGQAEAAAMRGEWSRSQEQAAEARKLVPAEAWTLLSRLDLVAALDARAQGDAGRARAIATRLHAKARRLGDAVMELQVHRAFLPGSLKQDCSVADREALVARTGMWGAGSEWTAVSGSHRVPPQTR